jgi:hypothetical protein
VNPWLGLTYLLVKNAPAYFYRHTKQEFKKFHKIEPFDSGNDVIHGSWIMIRSRIKKNFNIFFPLQPAKVAGLEPLNL